MDFTPIDPTILAGAIYGAIQAAKQAGLPDRFDALVGMGLGIVFGVAEQIKVHGATAANIGALISAGEVGMLLGLSAVALPVAASKIKSIRSGPAPVAPVDPPTPPAA